MKKVELLSPVGNMETLKYAVHNGADAVYLGIKKFNARAFSNNFTHEELIEAVKYCHLYNVKIYITMNTVIFDNEVEQFLEEVKFLHESGVDALIMQDIGMINLVKKTFPNLEIHASTQAHTHSNECIKFLRKLGVERVVLARELSIDEINKMDEKIEKEVFIHGALCVCYSGCCLFSSMNGKRSANRGECVASCRLPYKLIENDKVIETEGPYLLSMKELSSLNHLEKLLSSNIDSLKIEGRMKSPEYVGFITKLYRRLLDDYYMGKTLSITKEEITDLKKLFNREFTKGFLNNENKKDIVNIKSPNHIGINIGKVIEVNKNKIKILLSSPLHQEDGIRFKSFKEGMTLNKLYNEKGKLVNHLDKGEIAVIDNKIGLNTKDEVLKTTDYLLMNKISDLKEKKIPVTIKVVCKKEKPLELTIIDELNNKITISGEKVEKSITTPTTKERIELQIKKLGQTPFICTNIISDIDNDIFISIKQINELRRKLIEKLKELRESKKKEVIYTPYDLTFKENKNNSIKISILTRTEEQLKIALENNIDYIYIDDYNLYQKYKNNKNVYYKTSRLSKNKNDFNNENLLVTEIGALEKYHKNNNLVSDYYLNINNRYSYSLLRNYVEKVTLSPEFRPDSYNKYYNAEIIIYGRIELMITKYCPLEKLVNKDKTCSICKQNNKYYLQDIKGNKYPIINKQEITHIMHYKNIDLINDIDTYINIGITNYRIELFDEDISQTKNIINILKNKLKSR